MSLISWMKRLFFGEDHLINVAAYKSQAQALSIERFGIEAGINLIAGAVSKCEFRTFSKNTEIFSDEYYLFNVRPNRNQNSSEFIYQWVRNLLLYGEALVIEVDGQLLVADSFGKKEFAIKDDVFTGVTCRGFTFERPFFASEVLYIKYGNDDIQAYLDEISKQYNELVLKAANKYKRSGGRKGILHIASNARGRPESETDYFKIINERFAPYYEAENAVLNLNEGFDYQENDQKQARMSGTEINDIKILGDEAMNRAAQRLKIPPALLKGEIADVKNATNNFLTFCIDPFCDILSEEINAKRYGRRAYLTGSKLEIDTTCIVHIDIFGVSESIDKLIASRTYNNNEIRRKLRDSPIPEDWANEYVMTKNYEKTGKEENDNADNGTNEAGV